MPNHSAEDLQLNATVRLVLGHVGYLLATLDGPPHMPMPDFRHAGLSDEIRQLVVSSFVGAARRLRTGRYLTPVLDLALVAEHHRYIDELFFLVTMAPVSLADADCRPAGGRLYRLGNGGRQALTVCTAALDWQVANYRRRAALQGAVADARAQAAARLQAVTAELIEPLNALMAANPENELVREVRNWRLDSLETVLAAQVLLRPLRVAAMTPSPADLVL